MEAIRLLLCGGTLDPDTRWLIFPSLMPGEELEEPSVSVQSHGLRSSQASEGGVWSSVQHAAAWLER